VLENHLLRWIPDISTFRQRGYSFAAIHELPSSPFSSYTMGYQLPSANVLRLVRTPQDSRIWELYRDGRRKWIPSAQAFKAFGYSFSRIQIISESELASHPRIALIRSIADTYIYYITPFGRIHHIPSAKVFTSYGSRFQDVFLIAPSELQFYKLSYLIQQSGDSRVYLLENGTRRWITSIQVFKQHGYDFRDITIINAVEMNSYPEGNPVTS